MSFTTVTLFDSSTGLIQETHRSGSRSYTSGGTPSASISYTLTGFPSSGDAYAALSAYVEHNPPYPPMTRGADGKNRFHGLPCTSINVSRNESGLIYDAVVNFSLPLSSTSDRAGVDGNPDSEIITDPAYNIPAVQDTDWSFSSSLMSSHTDWGLFKTGSARYDSGTPIDFGTYIGPCSDGTFTGSDIQVPVVNFTITRSEPPTYLNQARRLLLAGLTGGINSAVWQGFGVGNVMFTGFNAQTAWLQFGDENNKARYWRTSYSFSARPSSSMVVGSVTLPVGGWCTVSKTDNQLSYSDAGAAIWTAGQVDVISCYNLIDFSLIGLTFPQ